MSKLGKIKTSEETQEKSWFVSTFVFLGVVSFVGLALSFSAILLTNPYTNTPDLSIPSDGEPSVKVVSNREGLESDISLSFFSTAVLRDGGITDGAKTLITNGATKMDESRLYLTPESVARFLDTPEGRGQVRDEIKTDKSTVLAEISLEPDNPNSSTFWLYHAENDGFYINRSEISETTLWETSFKAVENRESARIEKIRKDLMLGTLIAIGVIFVVSLAVVKENVFDKRKEKTGAIKCLN